MAYDAEVSVERRKCEVYICLDLVTYICHPNTVKTDVGSGVYGQLGQHSEMRPHLSKNKQKQKQKIHAWQILIASHDFVSKRCF